MSSSKRRRASDHPGLGVDSDANIARELGCSRQLVHQVRSERRVPAAAGVPYTPRAEDPRRRALREDPGFETDAIEDVARRLGVSPSTVSRERHENGKFSVLQRRRAARTQENDCLTDTIATDPRLARATTADMADAYGCSRSLVEVARGRAGLVTHRPGGIIAHLLADPELLERLPIELAERHGCSLASVSRALAVRPRIYGKNTS